MEKRDIIESVINADSQYLAQGIGVPSKIIIVGIVVNKQKKKAKSGDYYGMITLEDLKGKFEITLYKEKFKDHYDALDIGEIYCIVGNQSNFNGDDALLKINPNSIKPYDQFRKEVGGEITINISHEDLIKILKTDYLEQIKKHKGKHQLRFVVETQEWDDVVLLSQEFTVDPCFDFCSFWSKNHIPYSIQGKLE